MSVVERLERELAKMPQDLADSTLAGSALALAAELDDTNSATSKSMCAKALLETMDRIRSLIPEEEQKDNVYAINARRAKRLAG